MTIRRNAVPALLMLLGLLLAVSSARAANVAYSDIQAIFSAKCTGCHGGAGGLSLAAGSSYGNMVMVVSTANAAQFRVKPFDSANSNLYVKVKAGGSMNGFLNATDITNIQNWIDQGASTSYTVTPAASTAVAGSDVSISAQLKNMNGNNVNLSGITVTWSKTGGGSFSAATSTTDASGVATVTFTTGTAAGINQTVTATTNPTTGTSGNIAITAGPAAKYKVTSSSGTASPGTSVTITAQLVDANNNAVSTQGVVVNWTSNNGGSFSAASSATNASGVATISFTVGANLGTTYMVTATDTNNMTGTTTAIKVSSAGAVELVTAKPDGTVALGGHYSGATVSSALVGTISQDGRYMLFVSDATTLTADPDTNAKSDLYVRDLQTGTTTLVSMNATNTAACDNGVYDSAIPVISANGRYVTFVSDSTNLVTPTPSAYRHVYRRDLQTNTTILVSASTAGVPAGAHCDVPLMSDDGRYITFTSGATNLTTLADANGVSDIFWHDCEQNTTLLVSVNAAGTAAGSALADSPCMSADGKYVAFHSMSNNIVASAVTGTGDIYRRDMFTNGTSSTVLVSARTGTTTTAGNAASNNPVINATGQFVTFDSAASNLVTTDANGVQDIFRRDCTNNVTVCISAVDGGTTPGSANADYGPALMSADGRYVVFISDKTNLVTGDTNGGTDIFRRDCDTNKTILVSAKDGTTTITQNGGNSKPVVSADGRFVAFSSSQPDLTAHGNQGGYQIYRRDTVTNATILISVSLDDKAGNADAQRHCMSADASRVGFDSYSNNLITQNTAFNLNVFAVSTNAAPQVNALADATAAEGATFTQNGTISDDNSLDTFTATVDYGDGGGAVPLNVSGSNFTLSHVFPDNGVYTIKIAVTDNHGAVGNGTQKVTVSNVSPTVSINNAPATGTVGGTIGLNAGYTDPGSLDTFTFAWTVKKDGAPYGSGSAANYSFAPDAAGTYVVNLTVADKDGGSNSASASISVAKPDGFAGAPTKITDSSPAAGATTYEWDFGDGSPKITTSEPNVDHVFAAPGTYTVTVTETDAAGAKTVKTFTVIVGGPISSLDNDGDGFPDELERGIGSDPADAKSTPFNISGPVTAVDATTPKTAIKLNFAKAGSDSITVSGTLPFTSGWAFANSGAAVDVGGAIEFFTLDAKGGAKKGKSSFKAQLLKGMTSAKFKATLKGTYAAALNDEGMSATQTVKSSVRTVTVYIIFAETLFKATPSMKYTSKSGKSASAKY
jgi:hypothetical protein